MEHLSGRDGRAWEGEEDADDFAEAEAQAEAEAAAGDPPEGDG